MFRSRKKLDREDIVKDLLTKVTDGPRIIGTPGPTANTLRELLARIKAAEEVEAECLDLNLAVAKTLKN